MPTDTLGRSARMIVVRVPHSTRPVLAVWLIVTITVVVWSLLQAQPIEQRTLYSDVSTHVMIAGSVWHDGDLEYSLDDLARFREDFPAESGPRGLFFKKAASGALVFAKPYLYGASAAPFYGWLGVDGFMMLNGLCLFVIGVAVTLALVPAFGTVWALVAALGFTLPGPFLAWVPVPHPDLFIAALLAAAGFLILQAQPLLQWPRLVGAVLLGAAIHEKPAFIVLVPFMLLAMPGPSRSLAKWLGVVVLTAASWLAFSSPNLIADGTLLAYQGDRFYAGRAPFPLEEGWVLPTTPGITGHVFSLTLLATSLLGNLTLLPEKLVDFFVGRQTGILVYFPVALLLLLAGLRYQLQRGLWLLFGFFLYLGLHWLAFPTNGYGGVGSYGPRYMMQALPLVALAFLRVVPDFGMRRFLGWQIALVVACVFALGVHQRAFAMDNSLVRMHARWFVERPLSLFPSENWLLPSTASPLRHIYEHGPSRRETLYDKSVLDGEVAMRRFFAGHGDRKILFQLGEPRPVSALELWPVGNEMVTVRKDGTILWRGELAAGQPVRIDPLYMKFEAQAFDLLSKNFIRRTYLEVISSRPAEHPPLLRFSKELRVFDAFGRDIEVAAFAAHGVSLLRGWSTIEPWGVWSQGGLAQLVLRSGEAAGAYEAILRMHAYVPAEDPLRRVRVSVNGRELENLEFSPGEGERELKFNFRIEPGEEYINLGFKILNPVSPAMLGRGGDGRMLGVGLKGIKLKRIEDGNG